MRQKDLLSKTVKSTPHSFGPWRRWNDSTILRLSRLSTAFLSVSGRSDRMITSHVPNEREDHTGGCCERCLDLERINRVNEIEDGNSQPLTARQADHPVTSPMGPRGSLGRGFWRECRSASPAFRVTEEGGRRTLSPILRDEVYRIARELLRCLRARIRTPGRSRDQVRSNSTSRTYPR
jgi:hypothetical protein